MDSEPTFDEYKAAVGRAVVEHPLWREGQAAFNVLWEMRPDLSRLIRATPLDPFYSFSVPPEFYAWVERSWEAESVEVAPPVLSRKQA